MTWVRGGKKNKSFLKRIKITGKGKVLKRPPGQGHFNARESGQGARDKKGDVATPKEIINRVKALIRQ